MSIGENLKLSGKKFISKICINGPSEVSFTEDGEIILTEVNSETTIPASEDPEGKPENGSFLDSIRYADKEEVSSE